MFSPNTTGQIAKIPANNGAGYEANDKRVTVPIWTSRISAQGLLAEAFSVRGEANNRHPVAARPGHAGGPFHAPPGT